MRTLTKSESFKYGWTYMMKGIGRVIYYGGWGHQIVFCTRDSFQEIIIDRKEIPEYGLYLCKTESANKNQIKLNKIHAQTNQHTHNVT